MGISARHEPDHEPDDSVGETASLEYLQRLIDTVPAGPYGIRWLHLPHAVLCLAQSDLDAPFDDFVSRVDIATVGRRFEGVQSSATEVLRCRPDGRTTLQLERIRARRKPDRPESPGGATQWLERIDYGTDQQRIWIRTVGDHGCSTVRYDGYLAFTRVAGRTRIACLACRRYPVPRLLTLVGLDRWTWLTRVLSQRAFRRFFGVTTANIMAAYHGKDRT